MRITASLTILLIAVLPTVAADMEWIEVSDNDTGFVLTESKQPFIPWGFNYDHEGDVCSRPLVVWVLRGSENPARTDADFQMKGRYEFDSSLGIEGLSEGRLLSATGRCEKEEGCTGSVRVAVPDAKAGLRFLERKR